MIWEKEKKRRARVGLGLVILLSYRTRAGLGPERLGPGPKFEARVQGSAIAISTEGDSTRTWSVWRGKPTRPPKPPPPRRRARVNMLSRGPRICSGAPVAKHSHNASHNFVLQLYLIKCTLSFFCLGWTHHLCLVGTAAMLISSLFASLFLPRDLHPEAIRNNTSFSLDPTLTKIWEHLRRDDANPPEDLRWC